MTGRGSKPRQSSAAPCLASGCWCSFPLWLLVVVYRLKLRQADLAGHGSDPRDWQFGIGQLLIVTAMVAVVLGIGRQLVIHFGDRLRGAGPDGPIFIFLAVAAAILSLPPKRSSTFSPGRDEYCIAR